MSEVDDLKQRVLAARERFQTLPVSESAEPGPPDPKTGERWDRYNVLGHMAEALPFWAVQLHRALGGETIGRPPGSAGRVEGIESGRLLGEQVLRDRIAAGIEDILGLLDKLQPTELDRPIDHVSRGKIPLREALEIYLIGHLEEHVGQLAGVTKAS